MERSGGSLREEAMEKHEGILTGGGKPEKRLAKDVARLYAWVNADHAAYQDFSRFKQRRSKTGPPVGTVKARDQARPFSDAPASERHLSASVSPSSEISRAVPDPAAGREGRPISRPETRPAATAAGADIGAPSKQPTPEHDAVPWPRSAPVHPLS